MPVEVMLRLPRTAGAPGPRRGPAAELHTAAAAELRTGAAAAAVVHHTDRATRRTAAAVGTVGRWRGTHPTDPARLGLASAAIY